MVANARRSRRRKSPEFLAPPSRFRYGVHLPSCSDGAPLVCTRFHAAASVIRKRPLSGALRCSFPFWSQRFSGFAIDEHFAFWCHLLDAQWKRDRDNPGTDYALAARTVQVGVLGLRRMLSNCPRWRIDCLAGMRCLTHRWIARVRDKVPGPSGSVRAAQLNR
jgi:hypothetical protein